MKIIIAGGRDFDNYEILKEYMDHAISLLGSSKVTIISGAARGADSLGELYAEENNFDIERFPAEWEKYGKGAGFKRNNQMADHADALIAFWDGESRGTQHMINTAKKKQIQVRVVKYNNDA